MMTGETVVSLQSLPTTPDDLFARLGVLRIPFDLHRHRAVFTVAESEGVERDIPGIHCRNLFLRDKREKMFLVVAANETKIDLKKLQNLLGCDRLSFGSTDRLWRVLGVRPGSVCPFSVINDRDRAVTVILDAAMMAGARINYHPLDNTMTIGLTPGDLLKFLDYTGHVPHVMDLGPVAPDPKGEE